MKMVFCRVLLCEWKKLRTSTIWIPVLAAPLLTALLGILISQGHLVQENSGNPWPAIYFETVQVYAILFLPMLAGILASLVCRGEHLTGGWKQLLALPVRRTDVYAAKFIYVLLFLVLAQGLVWGVVLVNGLVLFHVQAAIPWSLLSEGFIGGWIATIPLAALQLWAGTWWKSFGAPFALNIILTIPALAVAHSSIYGPIYPWAQPMLAMLPSQHGVWTVAGVFSVSAKTALTIAIAGVVFITGGWLHFIKRDIHA